MRGWLIVSALLFTTCVAHAQDNESDETSAPEEVLVTGEYPGPGMWKVRRADDADDHVLWILGSPPPLPKKLKWKSTEVEAVVLQSQEILLGASLSVKPDKDIGFFRGLTLLPAALGARKNPEGVKLKEVVGPEAYARWAPLKKRYLGKNNAVESFRPIFAGWKLRGEAFDDLKLRENEMVAEVVTKLAKQHKIKTTTAAIEFPISTKDIRAKIKQFAKEPLADRECFDTLLSLVEALGDHETMQARATAWATGDLETLIAIDPLPNPNIACQAAVMSSQIARDVIPSDIGAQLKAAWLAAAEKSLATNKSTFAYLQLPELTSDDGQLAALRAKGYVIDEP